jgi:hypothetical protein
VHGPDDLENGGVVGENDVTADVLLDVGEQGQAVNEHCSALGLASLSLRMPHLGVRVTHPATSQATQFQA